MLKGSLGALIFLGLFMSHCQSVNAPSGSVPKRIGLATNAFGGWVSISFLDSTRQTVEGEFIAVSNDTVYVMVGDEIDPRNVADIRTARIILFNTETAAYGVWTALTSLGTISNGGFLIFTLPMTILTGVATTIGESKRINFFEYPTHDWKMLSRYARFPQGVPTGVNLYDLEPQPVSN